METAIITGASRGIGKAVAEELASRKYNVALISRHRYEIEEASEDIEKANSGISVLSYACDVRDIEGIGKVFYDVYNELGSVDVLVNNAGINSRKILSDEMDDYFRGFEEEVEINLLGTNICSRIAAEYMLKQKHGSIVNISSIKGKEPTSSPGYGTSKAGVIKLTRDFAKALAKHGIRVNCVAPGFIDTGMTTELPEEKKQAYKKLIPQGRFGTVEEVARAVAFLVSSDASYITGETINVNGGYLMY